MSGSTLRFVRFFAPAVILVVLSYAIAKMLKISSAEVPVSVNDLGYNLGYIIVAAIYHYLPLRDWVYRPFLNSVHERIRAELVCISELPEDTDRFSWKNLKNIFYWLIDNDESLKVRADDIRFNGALMTSFADLTIISILFLVGCLLSMSLGFSAGRPALLLAVVTAISISMQLVAMLRHRELGKRQLSYIKQIKKAELIAAMQKIDA